MPFNIFFKSEDVDSTPVRNAPWITCNPQLAISSSGGTFMFDCCLFKRSSTFQLVFGPSIDCCNMFLVGNSCKAAFNSALKFSALGRFRNLESK